MTLPTSLRMAVIIEPKSLFKSNCLLDVEVMAPAIPSMVGSESFLIDPLGVKERGIVQHSYYYSIVHRTILDIPFPVLILLSRCITHCLTFHKAIYRIPQPDASLFAHMWICIHLQQPDGQTFTSRSFSFQLNYYTRSAWNRWPDPGAHD